MSLFDSITSIPSDPFIQPSNLLTALQSRLAQLLSSRLHIYITITSIVVILLLTIIHP